MSIFYVHLSVSADLLKLPRTVLKRNFRLDQGNIVTKIYIYPTNDLLLHLGSNHCSVVFFRQEARQRDGFSREAGRFLRLVLSHGGTRPPVELLSDFFEAENPLSLESDYFPPGAWPPWNFRSTIFLQEKLNSGFEADWVFFGFVANCAHTEPETQWWWFGPV